MKSITISLLVSALLLFQSCSKSSSNGPEAKLPIVTTVAVTGITPTTAECGGTITSDGGAAIIARGVCWSTNQAPTTVDHKTTDGTGTGSFTSAVTGLSGSTRYYVRAYATNGAGTGYGDTMSFTTNRETGTVTDVDGNTYRTVKIGNQWWMAENMKVTHYRTGAAIPNVTDNGAWNGLSTGAYCEHDNNTAEVTVYGRLYNWFAATDDRNIAPTGWHVPTDAEWQTLVDYLGGYEVAGGKMKDTGTVYWNSPNTNATNESGFTGLPGGGRGGEGAYFHNGAGAGFWTATGHLYFEDSAWNRLLTYNHPEVIHDYSGKRSGSSVRCVKD